MTKRQTIERKLDDLIRQILRKRDTECITCGSKKDLTVGHFMKRRHLATRWDLRNVNAQCWMCNTEDDWGKYRDRMIYKYGFSATAQVIKAARRNVKFSTEDLKDLYTELKSYNDETQEA